MMVIARMKTNGIESPLGFCLDEAPCLSWVTQVSDKSQGIRQEAARVEVSQDAQFSSLLHDSGRRKDISSLCYPLSGVALRPRTRYFWRVTVWTDKGESLRSRTAWFETAKLDEPWTARWITPAEEISGLPLLFSSARVQKPVASARAYVCGLGLYELRINGRKVSDDCLTPGLTAYDKWIAYQCYDVTGHLSPGANSLECELGEGWYKGRYGLGRRDPYRYGDSLAFICEIHITYEDGSKDCIATHPSAWQARSSPIISSSIYDGETRDDSAGAGDIYSVCKAEESEQLTARLKPRLCQPIRIKKRIRPVEIIRTPAGERVLDMGQNMVGWLAFENKAPRGESVHLQFGEVLQNGNFYRDNLRSALCEYRYTSGGKGGEVRPKFTFYGFRYVKLTKWPENADLNDFEGLVLYSDLEETGLVETGSPLVNRLFNNALWSQRGNFLDVPTDCPQRDERMGWTGDAQMFFGTAAYNMDVYAFYNKYCHDLMKEQEALDGNVPIVVPKAGSPFAGSCAWGDAATIIPWGLYCRYGNKGALKRHYPGMKAWVDHIIRWDEDRGGDRLWKGDFHFGDWLALDNEDPVANRFGGTDKSYLASAFYCHSARLTAKAAAILGENDDARYYGGISDQVKQAIHEEYFSPKGRLAVNTQTAYVLALHMDLVPEEWREGLMHELRLKLRDSDHHLRTGFIGTPYLCGVLSRNGASDIAYRLLVQEDFPSWLYQVKMGATTIWERWNSILPDGSISDTGMNSLNHYAYGAIVEWLYSDAAGIQPLEAFPGFKRFRLAPKPSYRLGKMAAQFHSPAGTICSSWRVLENGELDFSFDIPFDTIAEITLPDSGGTPFESVRELTPGSHSFRYMPSRPYLPCFDLETPVSEILANEEAAAALRQSLPELTGLIMFPIMAGRKSLRDLSAEGHVSMEQLNSCGLLRLFSRISREK